MHTFICFIAMSCYPACGRGKGKNMDRVGMETEIKYELTEETTNGLHRIRALKDFANVKAGELGGWIESERNLSHEGNCWVSEDARVSGNAWVYGKI